ncbi:MAG: barstar family protein [Burkholderiales bacterium]|nr:barstar family protein [Burkholderiales bacterium]
MDKPKARPAPERWRIEFKGPKTRPALLKAIAAAMDFPPHFGVNLDALYDCLTDLPLRAGATHTVELVGLPRGSVGDPVHAVFVDAVDYWRDQGVRLDIVRD